MDFLFKEKGEQNMKIVAVVPIKLNNSRLPGKNIKQFTNGKPLCSYILTTLLSIKKIDKIYVYCSSEKIQNYLPEGVKFLKRPISLDTDDTKMNDVLQCFSKEVPADIYIMAHVTAPFVCVKSIEEGLEAVQSGMYDSAFAVKKLQDFLWRDGRPFNYELEYIPRTQDLPIIYKETSGFYIYLFQTIAKEKRRIGDKPYLVETGEIESIDIDEEEDFIIADAIYNYKNRRKE